MGEYRIREYEDRDYEAVRTMFSQGIKEHVSAAFRHALSCLQTHVLLAVGFLVAYAIAGSLLFSLGLLAALLVVGWIYIKFLYTNYVAEALAGDMQNIRQTYLEPKDCCFWVVESGKEAVGMVAAVHPEDPAQRGSALELKRMSVEKAHRGRGLSKALTWTVLRFARERGYKEVVLCTSMAQLTAQRVYEGLGFRRVRVVCPSLITKLVGFHIYCYCYEFPGSR
ncbi:putative N-acetyltransferase 8B [Varanus komodoensis]|nr:putative N-acetyltransferase 8B [Varanus komodoensis]